MAGDDHSDKTQEEPQAQEDPGHERSVQEQPQVATVGWERSSQSAMGGSRRSSSG